MNKFKSGDIVYHKDYTNFPRNIEYVKDKKYKIYGFYDLVKESDLIKAEISSEEWNKLLGAKED